MELLLNPEGTLIDNSPCMAAGIDFACRLLTGREPDRTTKGSFGLAPEAALAAALDAPAASEQVKDATLLCASFYLEHWPRLARPYDGAIDAVNSWRDAGGSVTAIVDRPMIASTLNTLGLEVDRVEVIPTGTCPLEGRLSVISRRIEAIPHQGAMWLTDWLAEWRAGLERRIPTVLTGWGRFGHRHEKFGCISSPRVLTELLQANATMH